jgi:hypothetical protein
MRGEALGSALVLVRERELRERARGHERGGAREQGAPRDARFRHA